MAKITYVEPDGTQHLVDVADGLTALDGALDRGIVGVLGECGGACACATCHVYVGGDWMSKLGPRSEVEDAMLDATAADRSTNSRLSCQIIITEELHGLSLILPERQV